MNLLPILKALFASAPRITPADCAARVQAGDAVLVDVRETGEWARGVAQGAVLLPLSDLMGSRTRWKPFLAANADRELLLYCHLGGRSGLAARILVAEGIRAGNAGGVRRLLDAGWPVDKPDAKPPEPDHST